MRVVLLEDVEKLGKRGTVLNVADGYGRNFLIPRKLAAPATEANLKRIELEKKRQKVQEVKEEKGASELKQELDRLSLTISMKAGEGDMLFGAVTAVHIAEALERAGYSIDKRKIELEEPIKRLGEYQVPVKLHRTIISEVKISVIKE